MDRRLSRGLLVGAAVIGLAAGTPAFAEGSWSSSMSGVLPGFESRRWNDTNADSTSTSVAFSGCSVEGRTFRAATLIVWKDVFGPDESKGTRTNYCNTTSWGDLAAGSYYFEVDGFTDCCYLKVDALTTRY
ncbi:hypothetical protein SNE510_75840 [Streptomyces sp. NE5-10]|uniref:hypothetical protein n=1 Tax=Streptomyces hydrogenans TaxID=1873719 RepID=UPI001A488284|nr:hypothetical protein SNE510_75840 [Streptomyces sp. NE5-10]